DHVRAVFEHGGDKTQKARFGVVLIDEAVGRRRVDRLDDAANLVDINFVRELRPEDDAGLRETAPDSARRFNARQLRHLYVHHAKLRAVLQGKLDGLLAVAGFDDRRVGDEFALQQFAQVTSL